MAGVGEETQACEGSQSRVLGRLADVARGQGLGLVVLFGSRADGEVRGESDWDLAVVPGRRLTPEGHLELVGVFSDVLGDRVDVVVLSASTDPVLLREVFGPRSVPVYEAEPEIFHEWRSLAGRIYAANEAEKAADINLKVHANKMSKLAFPAGIFHRWN